MIANLIEFCRATQLTFTFNLLDLITILAVLLLISVVFSGVKLITRSFKKERMINAHLRKTRIRIARVVEEIEQRDEFRTYAEEIRIEVSQVTRPSCTVQYEESLNKNTEKHASQQMFVDFEAMIERTRPVLNEKEQAKEVPEELPKVKKTRAMSMEERWADFDRKRGMKNSA